MATQPTFSPDQDMSNVTPEDVAEAKRRTKAEAAYNKAASTVPKPAASAASSSKRMAKGGVTRADGCITKGHTKGRMV
jgi:type IV secretory pathway TrbL component